ncbi:alpha-L-arabinofuranosidase, partial [Streptomyces tateyamensis]
LLAAGPLCTTAPSAGAAATATSAATVSVNAGQSLATVPATAIGTNGSVYDSKLTDAAVPGLLKQAGVGLVRFPGGSSSDSYNWKTNSDLTYGTQAVDFDHYATMLQQSGAQGMVTVNYGSGDTIGAAETPAETGAQLAADWVRYANVTHNYRIKYWEIGNEIYGNGTYSANWETDKHCASGSNPSNCGPAVYAQNVKAYIAAMKAVDPTIQIGVVLTAPGNWPDGVTSAGSPQPWNQTVMTALAGQIGFADVHWYPQNPSSVTPPGPTDAGLLAASAQIPAMVSTLHTQLGQYAGSSTVPIMVTETNSVSSNPGKQTVGLVNALFLPQDYLGWLANGVASVDWWQIHNGIVTSGDNGSGLYGSAAYGDYGMLADGSCATDGSQLCEPAADTPFPAYNGMALLGQFVHPGETLVAASSNQSLLQAYSVKAADGSLRVLLVNNDPTNSYQVGLGYTGFTPATGTPTVTTMAGPTAALTTAGAGTASSQTVAPYSAVLVTLHPGGTVTPPPTPGTPTASGVTGSSVTLGWAASTGAAGYDVVRLAGSAETVVAAPTSASATVTGLQPNTAYTFAVYARDAAGNRSARSGSVTVTTAAASGGGSCKVGYSVNDWGSGFTATLLLTNTGSTPVNGWTLSFGWPGNQQLTNGWNAGWTQSGSTVTGTSLSYNGALAPGASTSIGFNAAYSGSNQAPSGFTLNGAVCS